MTERYQFSIAYNGRSYFGFQAQPQKVTIQSTLEDALFKILGESVRVMASGRTDTGVHALQQVLHVTFNTDKALTRVKKSDFLHKFNSVLPDDIVVHNFKHAENFHARNHAKKKTYEYLILQSDAQNPFLESLTWRILAPLNIAKMQQAAKILIGEHDFSSFCAADSDAHDKIRKIYSIKIHHRNPAPFFTSKHEKFVRLEFTGAGFLKQMIRNITGTLVQVGLGKITAKEFKTILNSRDRRKAAATAPARGLYLKEVNYE